MRLRKLTHRQRVLNVIGAHRNDQHLTGQQIAQDAGLTYKQTIDALNALLNHERVARIIRKFTARWLMRVEKPQELDPLKALESVFTSMKQQ